MKSYAHKQWGMYLVCVCAWTKLCYAQKAHNQGHLSELDTTVWPNSDAHVTSSLCLVWCARGYHVSEDGGRGSVANETTS